MADEAFNQALHTFRTQQTGLNSSGGQASGGDGYANEKESPEIIFAAAGKGVGWGAKLIGSAVPIPINFGEVSVLQQFDSRQGSGIDRPINEGAANLSAKGGVLYNLIFAPLIKNGTIQDLTAQTNGSVNLLDSPEFRADATNFDAVASNPTDIGGSGNFAALGDLPPPLPSEAPAISSGRDTGIA